jgi:hypothetical protein
MDDWRWEISIRPQWQGQQPPFPHASRPHPQRPRASDPVMQVFYRNVPPVSAVEDKKYSDEDFKNAYTNMESIERPQRVKIHSPILLDDLERISGLTLPNLPHL